MALDREEATFLLAELHEALRRVRQLEDALRALADEA